MLSYEPKFCTLFDNQELLDACTSWHVSTTKFAAFVHQMKPLIINIPRNRSCNNQIRQHPKAEGGSKVQYMSRSKQVLIGPPIKT